MSVITEIRRKDLSSSVPPFKVTRGHRNRHGSIGYTYDFLLVIRRNYEPISYRFLASAGCSDLSLTLGGDVIRPSDHVRLFCVTLAEDLSLDRHVSNVCKSCFFWLRQLRRVRRSLDIESVKTLVHAFVTPPVDYCNSVLALSPMTITDKLQRVLCTSDHCDWEVRPLSVTATAR